jgi:hypothetical protein
MFVTFDSKMYCQAKGGNGIYTLKPLAACSRTVAPVRKDTHRVFPLLPASVFPCLFPVSAAGRAFFKAPVLKFSFPAVIGYGRYLKSLSKFPEGMPRPFIFHRPLLIANAVLPYSLYRHFY